MVIIIAKLENTPSSTIHWHEMVQARIQHTVDDHFKTISILFALVFCHLIALVGSKKFHYYWNCCDWYTDMLNTSKKSLLEMKWRHCTIFSSKSLMKLGTLSNKVQSKIHLCSDTQRGHLYVFFMHQYTTLIIIQLWPHTIVPKYWATLNWS